MKCLTNIRAVKTLTADLPENFAELADEALIHYEWQGDNVYIDRDSLSGSNVCPLSDSLIEVFEKHPDCHSILLCPR